MSRPIAPHPSRLMNLPLEIFRTILAEVVRLRRLKRALRLRLVNKVFSDELVEALCVSNVISNCGVTLGRWAYVRPYIERRLLERRTQGLPTLHIISQAAEVLASQHGAPLGYKDYVLQLLHVASIIGGQNVRLILCKGRGNYQKNKFQYDLLSAAASTNNISLVESLVDKELSGQWSIFRDPFTAATMTGSHEALNILLAADEKKHVLGTGRIRLLIRLAEKGDAEMVLRIIQSRPGLFTEVASRRNKKTSPRHLWPIYSILPVLYTPSVEVFKIMKKEMESSKLLRVGKNCRFKVFTHAVRWGWVEMTRYLIARGARLDLPHADAGVSENVLYWACRDGHDDIVEVLFENGAQICGSELGIAASKGHMSIVKNLLERGADIHAAASRNSLYGAAKKGYLDITRVLLDAGMDPNTGDTPPLFGAIESEHVGIFRLLVDRGADVARVSPEARKQAETTGLDSMLDLLDECALQEHTEVLR